MLNTTLILLTSASCLPAEGMTAFFGYERSAEAAYESVDSGPAVSTTSISAGLEGFERNGPTQFSWRVEVEQMGTDWNRRDVLPGQGTDLFDEVETLEATLTWTQPIQGNWGYWLYGGLESSRAGESPFKEADFTDAVSATLGAALTYQFSPDLMAGVGLIYAGAPADMEENWIPILQVYWKINESWTLQTRNGVIIEWSPEEASALRS